VVSPGPGTTTTPPTVTGLASPSIPAIPLASASSSVPMPTPQKVENTDLIGYVKRSVKDDEDFYFLRFESLQRTNIVALEVKLLRIKESIRLTGGISDQELDTLGETLEQHSKQDVSRRDKDESLTAYKAPHSRITAFSKAKRGSQK
jgi:hypothetical protein